MWTMEQENSRASGILFPAAVLAAISQLPQFNCGHSLWVSCETSRTYHSRFCLATLEKVEPKLQDEIQK